MSWALFTVLILSATALQGQQPTNRVQQVSKGVLQVGKITILQDSRTATLPATVNMTNGPVEYFLVTGTGKLHESIFRTEANPADLHVAMLLLGATVAPENLPPPDRAISGTKIWIEAQFAATNIQADRLVWNTATTNVMTPGPWVYNGARIIEGTFTAERDGLFVSLITDVDSLINNPRAGRENDEAWQVNTNLIPTLSTNVTLLFRLREK